MGRVEAQGPRKMTWESCQKLRRFLVRCREVSGPNLLDMSDDFFLGLIKKIFVTQGLDPQICAG